MKVKLKAAVLDASGLHKRGDIIEVDTINPFIMTPIDEADAEPIETPKPKKTTAKSKK
jgi:hypothetical protein